MTSQFTPKFVTVDEFDNYWNANLRDMLRTSANESNQAEMFLARVERRLMAYIDNNTFRRYKYEELCGKQLNAFKEAIILQAMYVYKNGDIGMDSGYDAERGLVAKRSELVELSVCQDAIDVLANAGLWNMSMKNRPRKFGGDILYGLGLAGGGSSGCCPSGGGSGGGGSGGGGGTPGPIGPQGPRGVSIESVTRVTDPENTGSGEANVYQVNLENGDVAGTFSVYNGQKGETGDAGANGRDGTNGTDGRDGADAGFGTPTSNTHEDSGSTRVAVTTDPSSPNTAKIFNFDFYNIKGADGITPTLNCANGSNIGTYRAEGPTVSRSTAGDNNYVFTFDYLRGAPGADGRNGTDGEGFASATATVDAYTGTPYVNVTTSGSGANKILNFSFHNLKGEAGAVFGNIQVASASVTTDTTDIPFSYATFTIPSNSIVVGAVANASGLANKAVIGISRPTLTSTTVFTDSDAQTVSIYYLTLT